MIVEPPLLTSILAQQEEKTEQKENGWEEIKKRRYYSGTFCPIGRSQGQFKIKRFAIRTTQDSLPMGFPRFTLTRSPSSSQPSPADSLASPSSWADRPALAEPRGQFWITLHPAELDLASFPSNSQMTLEGHCVRHHAAVRTFLLVCMAMQISIQSWPSTGIFSSVV